MACSPACGTAHAYADDISAMQASKTVSIFLKKGRQEIETDRMQMTGTPLGILSLDGRRKSSAFSEKLSYALSAGAKLAADNCDSFYFNELVQSVEPLYLKGLPVRLVPQKLRKFLLRQRNYPEFHEQSHRFQCGAAPYFRLESPNFALYF